MKDPKAKIYFGAALFNGRETVFNSILTEMLEKSGYEVKLPQRDGFEFSRLQKSMEQHMDSAAAKRATDVIIYLLDVGKYIYESDIFVADLNEPIDEGLVVEMTYAAFLGIPVIGFRTDVRSPYGSLESPLRGMHFFPAFQCNFFISDCIAAKSPRERKREISGLFKRLLGAIKKCRGWSRSSGAERIRFMRRRAEALFEDIDNIHSSEGLERIAERYSSKPSYFEEGIMPLHG